MLFLLRHQIVALINDFNNISSVSNELGTPRSTVRRWWIRNSELGDYQDDYNNCKSVRCFSDQQKESIIRMAEGNPFRTAVQIHRELQFECSVRTVRNRLLANELKARYAAKKIKMTSRHLSLRLRLYWSSLE